jgi:cephalosporin-C deacetylase-like acetyl esterase
MIRRTLVAAATVAALTGAIVPARATTPPPPTVPCQDTVDAVVDFTLPVSGGTAHGFYAVPANKPHGLVVFSHGHGHSSYSWQEHVARTARELGVIAVAMDGRDLVLDWNNLKAPGIPSSDGWSVKSAAEDGIAAAQLFEAACPTVHTIVNFRWDHGGHAGHQGQW